MKKDFTPQRQEEESNSTTMSQVLSMLSQQQQVQTKILEQQNKLFEMIGNRQRNQGSYGLQGKPTQIFRCYICNQPGHRVRDCPKRLKGAIGQAKAGTKSGVPEGEREDAKVVASDQAEVDVDDEIKDRTIWRRPAMTVIIAGRSVECLIDTG